MRAYQRVVVGKIVVGHIKTKVGVGNGGVRHVYRVNNLLERTRGEVLVRMNVVNGGNEMGERKAKCTAYLTKGINTSHDQ